MTRRKSSSSPSGSGGNGHASGHTGANGHAATLESVGTVTAAESDRLAAHLHRAGSDDCTADSVAGSASSAGARADRDAYAELAQADPAVSAEAPGKWLRPPEAAFRGATGFDGASGANRAAAPNETVQMSANSVSRGSAAGSSSGGCSSSRAARSDKSESVFSLTPPGTEPLPLDGATFVEAVHERVDLIALEEQLLRSADEKIVQRELAYLRELRYDKTASFSTDDEIPPRLVFDAPDSTQL